MSVAHILAGVLLAVAGGLAVVTASNQRRLASTTMDWLADEIGIDARRAVGVTGLRQVARSLLRALSGAVAARTPAATMERLHERLLHAGLSTTVSADELMTINVLTAGGAAATGLLWLGAAQPSPRLGIIGVVILGIAGVCAPRAWVSRRAASRQQAIFRELPDALDLMVISMEAGVAFDGALQIVSDHLQGPLGEEFQRLLAEMELGVSRRDALQNLRRRVDVPELNHVVISLLQADSLGMPVSRVLRVQATEMRTKRRQWAREKAGKLPIKILFPLVVFIFPPVMVIIIGPAASDIFKLFR